MLSFDDKQLHAVLAGAQSLPQDKRNDYLARIEAHLGIRCGRRFDDNDVTEAIALARNGLAHDKTTADVHNYPPRRQRR
jgi:hypothetical protein